MRRSRARVITLLSLSLLLAPAGRALADATTDQQIAAEALFQEAKGLIEEGRFAEACPKLAESHRLSPAIGVLLNLGGCYEKTGRIASAWATLNEAADRARAAQDPTREKLARDRADALAPRLPRLSIELATPAPDAVVERDGSVVPAALLGQPIPVDPGDHEIKLSAPGRTSRTVRVTVREGEAKVIQLELPPEAAPSPARPVRRPAPHGASPRVIAGVSVAAVGLVGVVVGAATGGVALSDMSRARSLCANADAGTGCSARALELQDAARPLSIASTVGFVVGGAAIGTGLVVALTAPKRSDARPAAALELAPNGLSLRGVF